MSYLSFVAPLAFVAGYFPIQHHLLVAAATLNPLYHLAEGLRGLLLGGPVAYHIAALLVLSVIAIAILVPFDIRLLRKRVLGEQRPDDALAVVYRGPEQHRPHQRSIQRRIRWRSKSAIGCPRAR